MDDEQLVNTLHTSKITSSEVSEQLQISEQTEIKIDTAREVDPINFFSVGAVKKQLIAILVLLL